MGHNLKVLSEDKVNQTLHTRSCNLELRENFHNHISDQRPVYTKEEFLALSDMWIEARRKYDEMGQPDPQEQNALLAHCNLPGDECLHEGRVALELTGNITSKEREMIHFHYNNLRLHMTEEDFMATARIWSESLRAYNQEYHQAVKLSDPNIRIPAVAEELYIPWLEEYLKQVEAGLPPFDPDNFWDMYLESKRWIRPEDEQRYSNGFLDPVTRTAPEYFNWNYLGTIYECIRKYGYGRGPFKYDYIHCEVLDDGRIHLHGAHRTACLKVLGYDEIPVIVPKPWKS